MDKAEIEKILSEFLTKYLSNYQHSISNVVYIPLVDIDKFSPDLGTEVLTNPDKIFEYAKENFDITLRITGLYDQVPIHSIRHDHINKLIEIRGIVTAMSDIHPVARVVKFMCNACGHEIDMQQNEDPDSVMRTPIICPHCGKKNFKIIGKEMIDAQKIIVEEETNESRTVSVPVLLTDDLTEPEFLSVIAPGSRIEVVGVVREKEKKTTKGQRIISSSFIMYANSLKSLEETYSKIKLSEDDIKQIKSFSSDPEVLRKLESVVAPEIFGYPTIKRALLLQQFGGVGGHKRGEIHVLLVGNPGVGKTKLSKAILKISPKGRYTTGTTSSKAGLTATVTKDGDSWILEAGALPLANGGFLVIDEIEKMTKDDALAMHEALEVEQIVINKANIHSTLPTKVAVLAIANPKLEKFSDYEPLINQINLSPALINRFDLIFFMTGVANEEEDKMVAHKMFENNALAEIDYSFLRKYISYAQSINPAWAKDAEEYVISFYTSLRRKAIESAQNNAPVPISPRQNEAIMRLSEASARARLSPIVETSDAKTAINLMMEFLKKCGVDPITGELDVGALEGVPTSKRNKMREIKKLMENEYHRGASIKDLAARMGIDRDEMELYIEEMSKNNLVYEPEPGIWKVLP